MVVVLVQPSRQGVSALGLGSVVAGVSPADGHGAVEAFDLAAGLRAVGTGSFRDQAKFGAGVAPGVVGRPVVGRDFSGGDPPGCGLGVPGQDVGSGEPG